MQKAIIFANTTDISNEAESLKVQVEKLRVYADKNQFEVVKEFCAPDDKNIGECPTFLNILEYIDQQDSKIHVIQYAGFTVKQGNIDNKFRELLKQKKIKMSSRPVSSSNRSRSVLDYALPHAATTYHKITSPLVNCRPRPLPEPCLRYLRTRLLMSTLHDQAKRFTIIRGRGSGNFLRKRLNFSQLMHPRFPRLFSHLNKRRRIS